MKKIKDLNISDNVYFVDIEEHIFERIFIEFNKNRKILPEYLYKDVVVDKYNLSEIELNNRGLLKFRDKDLEKSSCHFREKENMILAATSEEGINDELAIILKGVITVFTKKE